jgi:hypothetical protein
MVPGEAETTRRGRNGGLHCAVNGKLVPFTARTTYPAILPAAIGNIPAMITSIDLDQRFFEFGDDVRC